MAALQKDNNKQLGRLSRVAHVLHSLAEAFHSETASFRALFPVRRWPFTLFFSVSRRAKANRERFIVLFLSMLYRFMRADGKIRDDEQRVFDQVLYTEFKLGRRGSLESLRLLNEAREKQEDFHTIAKAYRAWAGDSVSLLENAYFFLYAMAVSDGEISGEEGRLLEDACRIFGLGEDNRKQIEDAYWSNAQSRDHSDSRSAGEQREASGESRAQFKTRDSSRSPSATKFPPRVLVWYSHLDLPAGSELALVKSSYRKLVKKYHPDVLATTGAPSEYLGYAKTRFREVQDAYDGLLEFLEQSEA